MASYRRFEIIDHPPPFLYPNPPTIFAPKPLPFTTHLFPPFTFDDDYHHHHHHALEILDHYPKPTLTPEILDFPSRFEFPPFFDSITTDLLRIETTPFHKRYQQIRRLDGPGLRTELCLQSLSDRVADLESKFDRLLLLKGKGKEKEKGKVVGRKYTWTEEIDDGVGRKYKWTGEIKGEEKKEKKEKKQLKHGGGDGVGERKYQWTAEVKGKDDEKRTYTWKATIGQEKKSKKEVEGEGSRVARIVEIEEPLDHGAVVLRQVFAKRVGAAANKGKKKELTPQDAAILIQISFREYLIRRSRALRAFRELAVAKAKLKEIRALFHNFSYRNRVARDAEEHQKFSEKIIVLLLTVDAIEGADLMIRTAKKSMLDELEAMLDVVDPHPAGKSLSIRRRTFDMPTGDIQKEIAEGVASVVQLLEE